MVTGRIEPCITTVSIVFLAFRYLLSTVSELVLNMYTQMVTNAKLFNLCLNLLEITSVEWWVRAPLALLPTSHQNVSFYTITELTNSTSTSYFR